MPDDQKLLDDIISSAARDQSVQIDPTRLSAETVSFLRDGLIAEGFNVVIAPIYAPIELPQVEQSDE